MEGEEFQRFHDQWMNQLEGILQQLRAAIMESEPNQRVLVSKTMEHYQAYYDAKSEMVQKKVELVLSPPWLSSMERVLLWMGGPRPTVVFGAVALRGMGEEEVKKMEEMKGEMRRREHEVEDMMRIVQVGVAALVRVKKGSVEEGWVMDKVVTGVRKVVEAADVLRMEVMMRVIEVLSSGQAVEFLNSVLSLLVRLHDWGVATDRKRPDKD
ncbi:hypothetical protein J5N97_004389 [Dioscorea zingiberensis]|uniref:DOG1 domain-containing protein n=1 Tax=Dioscorea zingiberensis TaxID=325984 RepID=A0A9D5D8A5_9LILI|nr:hypothetical protein J5N97_004389 [Dioscorea zingiberensis]